MFYFFSVNDIIRNKISCVCVYLLHCWNNVKCHFKLSLGKMVILAVFLLLFLWCKSDVIVFCQSYTELYKKLNYFIYVRAIFW